VSVFGIECQASPASLTLPNASFSSFMQPRRPDESPASQDSRAAVDDAHGMHEGDLVTGCLRLSAPPSLGFLLGASGAPLRTDAPTPAMARGPAATATACVERAPTSGKPQDGLETLDALEARLVARSRWFHCCMAPACCACAGRGAGERCAGRGAGERCVGRGAVERWQ